MWFLEGYLLGCVFITGILCGPDGLTDVDGAQWVLGVVGQLSFEYNIGETEFNRLFNDCAFRDYGIIARICYSCTKETHTKIIYRRITNPTGINPYQLFLNNWVQTNNNLNTDFELYESYNNLVNNMGKWTFCNYGSPAPGFPRDCGPYGNRFLWVGQWNYFNGPGGRRVAFYILTRNTEECRAKYVHLIIYNIIRIYNISFLD